MHKTIIIKKDEELTIPLLWLGEDNELVYDIILAESGASVVLWGLLIGKGSQEANLKITVTHDAPHTTSKINVKTALYDQAKTHIDGLIKVNGGAKGSEAWLAAHIMLLSDKATGEAIPSLEIIENDIKAGHATTIGRIDELQLFYLMSRGFDRRTARQIIVNGFLQDAVENLTPDMQTRALKALDLEA